MTGTPITDAAERASRQRPEGFYTDTEDAARDVAALAAAALTGPIAEDVECPTCGGDGGWPGDCSVCTGTGTVRLVVFVVTPAAVQLAEWVESDAAAAILDPQDGEQ